jgi:hypothetical protein
MLKLMTAFFPVRMATLLHVCKAACHNVRMAVSANIHTSIKRVRDSVHNVYI